MAFTLRRATLTDRPELERLIACAVRGLGRGDYTEAQLEAALRGAFGVDAQLIADETYFVVQASAGDGAILGCGGWSFRQTLFGGDSQPGRQAARLDPILDAARIRAFFVHPEYARRGIGRALLERCEAEAQAQGFRAATLMATLPGQRLYRAFGYMGEDRVEYDLGGGVSIAFVPMTKTF